MVVEQHWFPVGLETGVLDLLEPLRGLIDYPLSVQSDTQYCVHVEVSISLERANETAIKRIRYRRIFRVGGQRQKMKVRSWLLEERLKQQRRLRHTEWS
jgi:hypothetical protein